MTPIIEQLAPYFTPSNVAIILGQGMPIIVEFVNKYIPKEPRKFWIFTLNFGFLSTILFSALAGFLTAGAAGKLNPNDIVATALMIFTSSQVAYHTWFNNSNVQSKLQG